MFSTFRMAQRRRMLSRKWNLHERRLLEARFDREYPLLDTKIIVNWNGLMIDALAYGYQVLGKDRYLLMASKAARFILDTLKKPDGELCHTYTAGVVKQDVYLDDYAFFVRGLLGLYQATGDEEWLESAKRLTDAMIQLFWDDKNGGFYYTKADAEHLIVRTKNLMTPRFRPVMLSLSKIFWHLEQIIEVMLKKP